MLCFLRTLYLIIQSFVQILNLLLIAFCYCFHSLRKIFNFLLLLSYLALHFLLIFLQPRYLPISLLKLMIQISNIGVHFVSITILNVSRLFKLRHQCGDLIIFVFEDTGIILVLLLQFIESLFFLGTLLP